MPISAYVIGESQNPQPNQAGKEAAVTELLSKFMKVSVTC